MSKLQTGLTAAALAAAFAVTSVMPVSAAPIFVPKTVTAQSDVIQVRDGVRWRRNGWYNGHRGYRNYRPGYRYNNGLWFPGGAFVAGALIGGAIANSNSYYGNGYYGNGYYGNGYYPGGYYSQRVYYPPRASAYRQGYRDGFRAGYSARYYNDITCTPRLADAGKC